MQSWLNPTLKMLIMLSAVLTILLIFCCFCPNYILSFYGSLHMYMESCDLIGQQLCLAPRACQAKPLTQPNADRESSNSDMVQHLLHEEHVYKQGLINLTILSSVSMNYKIVNFIMRSVWAIWKKRSSTSS